jgi:hypothetical protein
MRIDYKTLLVWFKINWRSAANAFFFTGYDMSHPKSQNFLLKEKIKVYNIRAEIKEVWDSVWEALF